jgi:glycine oxidase
MNGIGVVGGGIIGCSIAWELARRGARVDVFDARPLGAGATRASAGMLVPYLEAHGAGPLRDLGVRSVSLYDDFIGRLRSDASADVEYRRCGSLQLAMDPDTALQFRRHAASGDAPVEWLDPAAIRRTAPGVSESCAGALLAPSHGYVVVGALVDALAQGASYHGARVHVGRGVSAIDVNDRHVSLGFDDGSTQEFERAILCAGSWTPRLGLDDGAARAIRPVRGQLVRLRWRGQPLQHIIWGPACYLVPWADGTVLVGATMEEVGYDERTTAAGVRDLLDAACDLLPDAWSATFLDARAGLRPASADGLPIVGPSSASGRVVYATGHFRNGIMLAPLTAQLVADYLLEGKHDPALDVLSPARFG